MSAREIHLPAYPINLNRFDHRVDRRLATVIPGYQNRELAVERNTLLDNHH